MTDIIDAGPNAGRARARIAEEEPPTTRKRGKRKAGAASSVSAKPGTRLDSSNSAGGLAGTPVFEMPRKSTSSLPLCQVSRFGSPPAAGMM